MNRKIPALILYVAAIVAANMMSAHLGLLPVGFGLLVSAGTFAAGFALVARDFLHRAGGIRWALAGIAIGCGLSVALSTPALALASAVAFGGAELVDLLIFARALPRFGLLRSILISNIVSAPLDTVIFLSIAGFPVTPASVAGQFIGKILWATLVPLAVLAIASRRREATA